MQRERERKELTHPGVQTAPGLAPAGEIYLISFSILCFETQNTTIRTAHKKFEGGRPERGGQQSIPVLPPAASLIIHSLFTVLLMKSLLFNKPLLHQLNKNSCETSQIKKLSTPVSSFKSQGWVSRHVGSAQARTAQLCPPPPRPPGENTPPAFLLHNITHSAQRAQLKSRSRVPKQTAFM